MDPGRFEEVARIFEEAIELPVQARAPFVESRCAGDDELRVEVESLLGHHESGAPVEVAVERRILAAIENGESTDEVGTPERIGAYRILGKLGEGGMGVVFRAEQENPAREVAVKLIRPGLVREESIRRFRLEAGVLGRLNHVGIAQIHEAGTWNDTGSELPYYAMELVRGRPLMEFLASEGTSIRERLELFASICDAVQHAHDRGVVHRDLKPGNLLVTAEGQPKILDFGVARTLDGDASTTRGATMSGQLVGTLAYMSPEQVAGRAHEIGERTDVYSLGVVLYEMLAGRLPYDLGGTTLAEAVRTLAERDPLPLRAIGRAFRGDLDTITQRALERHPGRRYATVRELANDVRRHLAHEPIAARPASTGYRMRKFARRHRGLVVGVAAVLVVLVTGILGTTRGMMRARDEAHRSETVRRFMQDVLLSPDPTAAGRADIPFVDVLRGAEDDVRERFADDPRTEIEVRDLLGRAFANVGMPDDALPHARRAVELATRLDGAGSARVHLARSRVAALLQQATRYDEAGHLAKEILEAIPAGRHASDTVAMRCRMILASCTGMSGDPGAAEAMLRPLVEDARRLVRHPANDRIRLRVTLELAALVADRARRAGDSRGATGDEALELLRAVVAESVRVGGPDSEATLEAKLSLARFLDTRTEFAEAADLARDVLARAEPRFGAAHPLCTQACQWLGESLRRLKRYDEAADPTVRAIEGLRARHGDRHPMTLALVVDGLETMFEAGRDARGEEYATIAVEGLESHVAHDAMPLVRIRAYRAAFRGRYAARAGELDRAVVALEEALELARRAESVGGLSCSLLEELLAIDEARADEPSAERRRVRLLAECGAKE